MNERAIGNAIKARLAGFTGCPIVWPNLPYSGVKPYAFAEVVRIARTDRTHGQQTPIARGRLVVTVVSDPGKGDGPSLDLAQGIADRFPTGIELTFTGGRVRTLQPADIREGFLQDGDWRQPVLVEYEAYPD